MSKDEELPGSVSNQNNEEAEPGHDGIGESHRKPTEGERGGGESSGEASEGSQSTGDPNSAG